MDACGNLACRRYSIVHVFFFLLPPAGEYPFGYDLTGQDMGMKNLTRFVGIHLGIFDGLLSNCFHGDERFPIADTRTAGGRNDDVFSAARFNFFI